ncbi:DUF350 domain-containing protein [sulfur-oxidizing endosymbiont of Gigantopelta aegis]|uniref:DUF350 domain-containing protein n=1 Tax=sulfur-oxidizing endosymbiont of Gigantopelta aegis TaxID=2794934 RepID=UPI0018DE0182|nr:DUF350 domain-containing protein [sulfur-oxidizing endosymbiont of Gigantopelta aegis]
MFTEFVNVELDLALYYLLDFTIAIALMSGMRYLAGIVSNVSAVDEISQKNNKAFGVSLAGAMIAVSIMLMGVISGDAGYNLANEAIMMLSFGVVGILLMWLTRIIFDRLSFPHLSIHDQIMQGNIAASIIDACNMIATAIIIKGAMSWVDGDTTMAMIAVIASFVASQIIMALATLYRVKVYAKRHDNQQLHTAIEGENIALALRFSAYRIGIAIAVSAAFTAVDFDASALSTVFILWFAIALFLLVLLTVVAIIIRHAVLHGINIGEEVGQQGNIAVGAIEGSIYIVVGLIIAGLIGS